MPEPKSHLSEWTLEQLAEDALSEFERQPALDHVRECARCAAELDAYRALFAALSDLPRFAPSPEFGDAVMARLQLAPQVDPLLVKLQRWLPSTRRGWGLLGAALVAPALPLLALVFWLFSQPMVSLAAIGEWTAAQATALASGAAARLMQWNTADLVLSQVERLYTVLAGVPLQLLMLAVATLAVAIPLSAWSLVRLLRTPMGNVTYAN